MRGGEERKRKNWLRAEMTTAERFVTVHTRLVRLVSGILSRHWQTNLASPGVVFRALNGSSDSRVAAPAAPTGNNPDAKPVLGSLSNFVGASKI